MALGDGLKQAWQDFTGQTAANQTAAAQAAAEANLGKALGDWDQYMAYLDTLQQPYSPGVIQQMTTQQRDIAGGMANEEMAQARRLAGASGLGGGGALANRERMIREEMARRNAATAQNIQSQAALQNSQFQQSIAGAKGNALSAITGLYANAPAGVNLANAGRATPQYSNIGKL